MEENSILKILCKIYNITYFYLQLSPCLHLYEICASIVSNCPDVIFNFFFNFYPYRGREINHFYDGDCCGKIQLSINCFFFFSNGRFVHPNIKLSNHFHLEWALGSIWCLSLLVFKSLYKIQLSSLIAAWLFRRISKHVKTVVWCKFTLET